MRYLRLIWRILAGTAALMLGLGLVLFGPLLAVLIFAMPKAGDKAAALGLLALYIASLRWLVYQALDRDTPAETLRKAKLRTEAARAHELRTRSANRRRTKAEQEAAVKRAYIRGAIEAKS